MFAAAIRRATSVPPLGHLARTAIAGLSALALVACQPVAGDGTARDPSTGPMIDPAQPVPVALLVPAGSGSADLDWLARSMVNAAKMAAADAQGARIDLRVYNTGTDSASAAARAAEAANAGAKILVGPLHAEAANAAGAAVRSQGLNVLSFSNNPQVAEGNVFILGTSFLNVADRLVGYGVKQGKRRYLIVAENDLAGKLGAAAITTAISRRGATLAGQISHETSQLGVDSVVPAVTAAAKQGTVDAVFVTANQGAVLPYLTGALKSSGAADAAQMMGLTRWDTPATRLTLPGVQGGWFALPDTTLSTQFESRYRAAYGEAPHHLAGLAYDGVAAIAANVRAGRKDALTTGALTRGSGFAGVNGVFRLRPDGTTERGLAVATIRNNQVVVLDPAPRSFGGFGF